MLLTSLAEHGTTDEQEHELLTTPMDRTAYVVGGELLSAFEGEVRKLRAMQAEALAGYHEVRRSSALYIWGVL